VENKMQATQLGRTSLPDAVRTILKSLEKGEGFSISQLSRETGLNRRTVEKALKLLEEVQETLAEKRLNIVKLQGTKMVQFRKNLGLSNLPENIQKLIIRTAYFPVPSREEELLVYVSQKGAFSAARAVPVERSSLVEKLLKQGQLLESGEGKVYLSEEGRIVAKGALKIYPELQSVVKNMM
jgi:DNA-binding transcriptional ArsR family regulator